MAIITESEYKGHKLLVIKEREDSKFPPFQFGVGKAKLIVENFDAIKKWYDLHKGDPKPARKEDSFS